MDTAGELEELKRRIKELEEANEDLDRKMRRGWRSYFLKEAVSLPKKCPKCDTGLLIVKPARNNGIYAACSNFPLMCNYYFKENKKKKRNLNAYELKYGI